MTDNAHETEAWVSDDLIDVAAARIRVALDKIEWDDDVRAAFEALGALVYMARWSGSA